MTSHPTHDQLAMPACSLPASALPWERVRRAVTASFAGFWDWEIATGHLWLSPQVPLMLGYRSDRLAPHWATWQDLMHPADRTRVMDEVEKHLKAGVKFDTDYRLRHSCGEYRWYRACGATYRDAMGRPEHMSGNLVEVHEYKLISEQLREQERVSAHQQRNDAIDCLSAGIAHEFNNLLQVVSGYMGFALQDLPDGTVRDDLRRAGDALEQASGLARRLLRFCRSDFANHNTEADLSEIIYDAAELVQPLLGGQHELRWIPCDTPAPVMIDTLCAQQAILNLCVNARDALSSSGEIVVRGQVMSLDAIAARQTPGLVPGQYAVLSVTDNGAGMSAETCERIFDPFFTTKAAGNGLGLGLSTVRTIARQAGGDVFVYSRLGIGSTFRLFIPLTESISMGSVEKPRPPELQRLGTVLFAEDDSRVRDIGTRMLEASGYRVIALSDGESALESYLSNSEQVDLLLLDAVMPGMDGRKVYEQVRKLAFDVPTLFCTGYDADSPMGRSLRELGCHVIEKPFCRQSLDAAIEATRQSAAANHT